VCEGSGSLAQQGAIHRNVLRSCIQKPPVYSFVHFFVVRSTNFFPLRPNCIGINALLDFLSVLQKRRQCRWADSIFFLRRRLFSSLCVSLVELFSSHLEKIACASFFSSIMPHTKTELRDLTFTITTNDNKITMNCNLYITTTY
jgi:hypothetical protein